MNKIVIAAVTHKNAYFPNIPYHIPICAGAYKNKIEGVEHYLNDNIGNNISVKNGYYNELTAQYWLWKNLVNADYIGMCHYRRYFNFNAKFRNTRVGESNTRKGSLFRKYNWNENAINTLVAANDIIVPGKTARCSRELNIGQLLGDCVRMDIIKQCINTLYPEYMPFFLDMLEERAIHSFNMFVMKKELFAEYSEWLFSILEMFEVEYTKRSDGNLRRYCGEFGEYLLNVWLNYQLANRELKVQELQTVMFFDTEINPTFKQVIYGIAKCSFMKLFPYGSKRHEWLQYNYFFK